MRQSLIRSVVVLSLLAMGCGDDGDDEPIDRVDGGGVDGGGIDGGGDGGGMDGGTDAAAPRDAAVDGATPAFSDASFALLELGHTMPVVHARLSGDRALSQDTTGRWNLWNLTDSSIIASGSAPLAPGTLAQVSQLRGPTLALPVDGGTELRSSADGRVIGVLPTSVENIAENGSYLWRQTNNHVDVWASDGGVLGGFDVEEGARVWAAANELRVATQVPAVGTGPHVQRFAPGSQTPTSTTPYQGNFVAWSADGEHFLVDGPALDEADQKFVGVHELSGNLRGKTLQQPGTSVFGGYRDLVIFTGREGQNTRTSVARVGTERVDSQRDISPLYVYSGVLFLTSGYVMFLDRSDFAFRSYAGFADQDPSNGNLLHIEGSNFHPRTERAVLYRTPINSDVKQVLGARGVSVSGSASGRVAVITEGPTFSSTPSDIVRIFDLTSGAPVLVSSFASYFGTLSADGAFYFHGGTMINATTGETIRSHGAFDIQFSLDGTRVLTKRCEGKFTKICTFDLATADLAQHFAAPIPVSESGGGSVSLSPDGKRVAQFTLAPNHVEIYQDGHSLGQRDAQLLGWLDGDHLLVADFGPDGTYVADVEIDVAGHVTRTIGKNAVGLPGERNRIAKRIDDNFFLLSETFPSVDAYPLASALTFKATIWSRSEARPVWTYVRPVEGTVLDPSVAGNYVVFLRDTQIIAERWR